MRIGTYLRIRRARGFSPGPNEARLLYDFAVSSAMLAIAAVFTSVYVRKPEIRWRDVLALAALPFLVVALNTILGVYSRLRTARVLAKTTALLGSIAGAVAAGFAVSATGPAVLLWAVVLTPMLVLPRIVIGATYSGRSRLRTIATQAHGPVLVIGGAGYIGCAVVELLLRKGHSVRVLDRLMYGRDAIAEFAGSGRFELIEGDVTDISKLTLAMHQATAVVHLAGLVGDPACAVDPEFTRHTNIVATRMAKEVAQSMGVQRFVFASSCSVYGTSDSEAVESGPLNPVSLYAQTKIDSERELLHNVADDFFVTVLRFATVFGHSRRPRFDLVANLFTAQAMADGRITVLGPRQWRPFIHVQDLARAILLALEAESTLIQSQVFNVGDRRQNMTILDLAELVKSVASNYRAVEISVQENEQDRRNYAVSFEKIRSLLGFEASVPVSMGIEEMASNFATGTYSHYKQEIYSNAATTAKALAQFQDPAELAHLYAPLTFSKHARG